MLEICTRHSKARDIRLRFGTLRRKVRLKLEIHIPNQCLEIASLHPKRSNYYNTVARSSFWTNNGQQSTSVLQIPRQKLRFPHAKTPILPLITRARNNQIHSRHPTLSLQPLIQLGINRLFHFCGPSLLEYLDKD